MSNDAEFSRVVEIIARSMLLGPWKPSAAHRELSSLVPGKQSWTVALSQQLFQQFSKKPKLETLKASLQQSAILQEAFQQDHKLRRCVASWERAAEKIARVILQSQETQEHRENRENQEARYNEVRWNAESISEEVQRLAGKRQKWIRSLTANLLSQHPNSCDETQLASAIVGDSDFIGAFERYKNVRAIANITLPPRMNPVKGAPKSWRVPEIVNPAELAQWFAIPLSEMLRLADGRYEFRSNPKAQHYRYRWSRKRSGGFRLIEAPKSKLKQVQRDITHGILARIPPHGAAHGFCMKRNIKSYAAPHTDQDLVLRMDLKDFFTRIQRGRVEAIFRTAGYPGAVAELLSLLCTVRTPRSVLQDVPTSNPDAADIDVYASTHLPQGGPASPALANLSAYRLDCRLNGLAKRFNANYTRYADDLLFSGACDFAKDASRFHVFALTIILEEGFQIHPRKTRMMRRGVRQKAAGLVLNDKVNTSRRDYERLKAILHNCAGGDPELQNRDGHENFRLHLRGLVGFHAQVNPNRGKKLLAAFHRAFPPEAERS